MFISVLLQIICCPALVKDNQHGSSWIENFDSKPATIPTLRVDFPVCNNYNSASLLHQTPESCINVDILV